MPTFKVELMNGQEAEASKKLLVFQWPAQSPADPQTLAWRVLPDLAQPAEPFAYELSLDLQVTARGSLAGAAALPGAGFAPIAAGAPYKVGAGLLAPQPSSGLGYGPGACLPGTPAALAGPLYSLEPFPGAADAAAGGSGELPGLAPTSGSRGSHGGRRDDGAGGDGGDRGSDSAG